MILEDLLSLKDETYKEFNADLIPTVKPENVIGVRVPKLRDYAKKIAGTDEAKQFLKQLPHTYLEENHLHAFLIEMEKDFGQCIDYLDQFLPYVDNWATCDSMKPKCFKKNKAKLIEKIKEWIKDDHEYTVRFAIGMLMNLYLDDDFKEEYLKWVCDVDRDEYYVKMMVAWYMATALAKQYESAIKIIEQGKLENWTHNKAIQKSVESYRITDEQKVYLKTYRKK